MSLRTNGSPKSVDSTIRTDSKTALRQEAIALRAENQWLRQQLAVQQERIEELESELKRYKNAHTPSSKQGGAGGQGENNTPDNDDEDSDVIYVDETGFPVNGDQHWIWTFVTENEVLYTVDQSRGNRVLKAVLGEEFAEDATLSCDGWSAYPAYHPKLQRCWAHLFRGGVRSGSTRRSRAVMRRIARDPRRFDGV